MSKLKYPNCLEEIELTVIGKYINSNIRTRMKCKLCGNEFKATPKSKMRNYKKHGRKGCPKCTWNARYKNVSDTHEMKLKNMGYKLITPYKGLYKEIEVINNNCGCGRAWTTRPSSILKDKLVCKPCNDEAKAERMHYWNDRRSKGALNKLEGFERYRKEVRLLSEQEFRDNIEYFTNGGKLHRGRNEYHLDHILSISFCFQYGIPANLCAHKSNLQLIKETDNIRKHKTASQRIPKIFDDYLDSSKIVKNFVAEVSSSFSITPKIWHNLDHIDIPIFFEEKNLAIFLIGFDLYKESNLKNKRYAHQIKNKLLSIGIRSLLFNESEWTNSKDLILGKIQHELGLNKSRKIYARKCNVVEIDSKTKSQFLNKVHIQGNDKSNINLGLMYGDDLVSVMTFSKPKIFMKGRNTKKDGVYELSRFANTNDGRVIGSFSKLLSHFIKNYEYTKIYSFADLRLSDGGLYEKNGFDNSEAIKPDYAYVINGELRHRWGFRKDMIKEKYPEIYDPKKTEYQMMRELGFDRIWDCGKIRYEIYKNA